jgi:hypothetical protein
VLEVDAGIVDEDVEAAEPVRGGDDRRLDRARDRDVHRLGHRRRTLAARFPTTARRRPRHGQ